MKLSYRANENEPKRLEQINNGGFKWIPFNYGIFR